VNAAPDGSLLLVGSPAVINVNDRHDWRAGAAVKPVGTEIAGVPVTGGGSNRSDDTVRGIREACRGAAFNPAGLDDPRCPGGAPQ
jgi:hypothetical protein